jgi:hypothetical protein
VNLFSEIPTAIFMVCKLMNAVMVCLLNFDHPNEHMNSIGSHIAAGNVNSIGSHIAIGYVVCLLGCVVVLVCLLVCVCVCVLGCVCWLGVSVAALSVCLFCRPPFLLLLFSLFASCLSSCPALCVFVFVS